jgi:hypothetical protein
VPDFHDSTLVQSQYWPELIALLKAQLGVRSAAAINTTVRDIGPPQEKDDQLNPSNPRANPKQSFSPFFIVHGDYTPAGARCHLRAMQPTFFEDTGSLDGTTAEERDEFYRLREEILAAEEKAMEEEGVRDHDQWKWSGANYRGPRWAMLSVWRPLETVRRDPLAVMDPRSLCNDLCVPLQRMYRARPGFVDEYLSENLFPLSPATGEGKAHRWYYISDQTPDEVWALKLFDSEAQKKGKGEGTKVAACAAHSAFSLQGQDREKPRRSAEVRVMVVW